MRVCLLFGARAGHLLGRCCRYALGLLAALGLAPPPGAAPQRDSRVPPLPAAAHRRGLAYRGNPLGWWIIFDVPGGGVATVIALEPGRYRLSVSSPRRQIKAAVYP